MAWFKLFLDGHLLSIQLVVSINTWTAHIFYLSSIRYSNFVAIVEFFRAPSIYFFSLFSSLLYIVFHTTFTFPIQCLIFRSLHFDHDNVIVKKKFLHLQFLKLNFKKFSTPHLWVNNAMTLDIFKLKKVFDNGHTMKKKYYECMRKPSKWNFRMFLTYSKVCFCFPSYHNAANIGNHGRYWHLIFNEFIHFRVSGKPKISKCLASSPVH